MDVHPSSASSGVPPETGETLSDWKKSPAALFRPTATWPPAKGEAFAGYSVPSDKPSPSDNASLQRLLEHPAIWRGRSVAHVEAFSTGFDALDRALPGHGR